MADVAAPVAAAPAASSSPVSTTAPVAVAAPAATVEAPAVAAVAAPAADPSLKRESFSSALSRTIDEKNAAAVEEPAADVEVKPATETEDKPAGEEEESLKEETKAEDEVSPDLEEEDPYEAAPGPLSAKELATKVTEIPELKAVLDAHPDLKNSLFAASRLASETAAYREVFVNPEQARIAAAGNQEFSALSALVTSIDKPEDAQGFYGRLMELSILKDEEGNPIMDQASGKPVSDGTVGRLIHHTGALFLNHFASVAEMENDNELAAIVDGLRARAFGSGPAPTQEDMTEEQRARAADLDARETKLKETNTATQKATLTAFNQSIATGIDDHTNSVIAGWLGRSDIPEADRAAVAEEIRKATYDLVVDNPQFHREQDELMRRSMGDKTRTARIALGKKYVGDHVVDVARAAIAKAGGKIIAKQAKSDAAQAAREEASRSEVAGTLRTARPVAAPNAEDQAKTAHANLTAKLGRAPTFSESFAEIKRMAAGQ
jgi:hypothetical protein